MPDRFQVFRGMCYFRILVRLFLATPRHLSHDDVVCCGHSYDVAADGTRFVMVKSKPESERWLSVELHALDRLRRPR